MQSRNGTRASELEKKLRDRMLGAAFKAFMANGYAHTTTLEIATRAKVSKRDLYAHFGSKQAILVACIASRAARMRLAPEPPVPRSRETLASTLTRFGATILREVCHPYVIAMFRLAIAEAERSPEVADTLDASRSLNRGVLVGLFVEAQKAGILRRGDSGQMVEQFFGLLWGDLMLGRLLGIAGAPKSTEISRRARDATRAFLTIYAIA